MSSVNGTPSISSFNNFKSDVVNTIHSATKKFKFADAIYRDISNYFSNVQLKVSNSVESQTICNLASKKEFSNHDVKTLASAIRSEEFNSLSPVLAKIITKLNDKQLSCMIRESYKNGDDATTINQRLNSLLTLQKIDSIIGFSALQEAKNISKLVEGEYHALHEEKKQTYLRTAKIYVLTTIEWVIDNFKMAFALNEFGGEVDDPAQASMRVMMLLSLWSSMNAWLISISTLLGSVALTAAIVSCGLFVATLGLVIYQKWFKSVPENCAPFENLTTFEGLGEWKGSDATLENNIKEVIDAWGANTESTWLMPILIGESGTGKTTIVEGVARRINEGKVPGIEKMFMVNCVNLKLDDSVKMNKNRSVDNLTKFKNVMFNFRWKLGVFLDEAHTLGMSTIIEKAKSFLAPGPMGFPYCVLATTPSEFKEHLSKNHAFVRRLKIIPVEPADKDTTILILETMAIQEADDLDIDDDVFKEIYQLCKTHFPKSAQPAIGKTILAKAFLEARHSKNKVLEKQLQAKKNDKMALGHKFQRSQIINTHSPEGKAYLEAEAALQKDIEDLEKLVNEENASYNKFATLRRERNALKKELYGMAIMINQGGVSEDYIKEFALKQNFLLPALDEQIKNYKPFYSNPNKTSEDQQIYHGIVNKALIKSIVLKEVEDLKSLSTTDLNHNMRLNDI